MLVFGNRRSFLYIQNDKYESENKQLDAMKNVFATYYLVYLIYFYLKHINDASCQLIC